MKCMHQMPTTPIAVAHIIFSSLQEMSAHESKTESGALTSFSSYRAPYHDDEAIQW